MNISKLIRYGKKVIELGPQQSFYSIKNRLQIQHFVQAWRNKAYTKTAQHTWPAIAKKHTCSSDFKQFFATLQQKSLASCLQQFHGYTQNEKTTVQLADQFSKNCFDLLGSGTHCFDTINWHTDFRLQFQNPQADCSFDNTLFYKDIFIEPGQTEQLEKDIKVPWERSRFQHLFVLGKAYEITNNEIYADTFVSHVSSWLEQNPFLLGTNWVCPMEVAIRAINWIWAFHFFKQAPSISSAFWQQFVCSLYDHLFYLENNWEWYNGQTSNHYLSDLLGYWYLCWFFDDLSGISKERNWCYHQLLQEYEKQVFDEGADYEGSTCYHQLVTEIFYHFYLLSKEQRIILPHSFTQKLHRMFDFINGCTPTNGALTQIGDNDSGRILYYGITKELVATMKSSSKPTSPAAHYPAFGLSIIKTATWHITVRHNSYTKPQISGHFHNDALSITLSVNGIPIFIDPGSYLYTASSVWRNRFRSVQAHNTFFIHDKEPALLDNRLFAIDRNEYTVSDQERPIETHSNSIQVTATDNAYKKLGLERQRTVACNTNNARVKITDCWITIPKQKIPTNIVSAWNFMLHPSVKVTQKDNTWIFIHNNTPYLKMSSQNLAFSLCSTWISFNYGEKTKSLCLQATDTIVQSQPIEIDLISL